MTQTQPSSARGVLTPGSCWDVQGLTATGKVRQINEDAFLVHPDTPLWLVADGMGGHTRGDLASAGIVRAFAALALPERLSDRVELAEATLLDLNAEFRALANAGHAGSTIGSTVVVLLAWGDYAVFLWVGDSRLYRWRRGRCERLTQDHSQVEELIACGRLRRDQAESHPAANVITRAVGAADTLFVDMDYCPVEPGDRFLLCTDGLTKEVPEPAITAILAQDRDAATLCRDLLDRALRAGGRDNITVVVACAHGAPGAAR
jgi:serine/threonine protein phosphatase PrpC